MRTNQNLNPKIYVACLSAYNSGHLHGEWIDVTDEKSIYEAIKKILATSPVVDAEEWAIHDTSDFGNNIIGEYSSIESVCENATFIKTHGAVAIGLLEYYNNLDDALAALDNFYHGEWGSELDFASEFFHEAHHDISDDISFYIDYEKFCRDIFINDFFSLEVDGKAHVFAYH